MAEKDTKPKTTAKPAANSVKPTAKPTTAAKPAATVKPTSSTAAKPAATAKPVAKPAATVKPAAKPVAKPATTATPAAKPAATVKPVAKPTAAPTAAKTSGKATVIDAKPAGKPAATVKPAAKPATTATPAAKPAATAKPAAKPATTATPAAKPTATAQVKKPVAAATSTAPKGAEKSAPAPKQEKPKAAAATAAKPEKAKKQPKEKAAKKSGGSGKAQSVAMTKNNKIRFIAIAAVALVLVVALILGIVLGTKSCKASSPDGDGPGLGGNITIDIPTNGNYVSGDLVPGDEYEAVTAGREHYFDNSDPEDLTKYSTYNKPTYNPDYNTNTAVGTVSEVIGTVERNIPEKVRDEGLGAYPKYGYTLTTSIGNSAEMRAARTALIKESSYLTATGTKNAGGGGYTWMDENGYLYSGTRPAIAQDILDENGNVVTKSNLTLDNSGMHRRLYKHSASQGLYMGDVSPDETAIIKSVTMRPRSYTNGYGVTGVYAPAGEVIKIQMTEADMAATGGITIHIGQALFNGKSNNIWTDKGQMQRFPNILNTMQVNKGTAVFNEETNMWEAYVGSFLGGPLYIRNESVTFTAIISGGVAYRHFILGYTTEEEFAELSKSSAPYFDLEVWDKGVLHSGPLNYAKRFSYDQIYKVAVLWDKVATVATTNGANQGIVFLYDPFVAAGAAVAFPGQNSVNCPAGWMASALNYDGIVTSGDWGDFHEYHHNFQNYGVGDRGEVTNNALTLVSYSLFTKISAARQIGSYGGAGMSGWNQYTSATWALNRVNTGAISSTNGLSVYATLLHNLGQDAFIKARGQSNAAYFNKWAQITHQDFTYYQSLVSAYAVNSTPTEVGNYPTFVPVSSVYQTGRTYIYRNFNDDNVETSQEKREIKTMQPYIIPTVKPFTVDLRAYNAPGGQYADGSIVIGNGFTFRIKGVKAEGINGTWAATDTEGVYTYTPDGTKLSGKIYVTLEIAQVVRDSNNNIVLDENGYPVFGERTYNGHALDDVDLILEFQPSHESTKLTLERTVYTFDAENMYTDAVEAFEAGFAGNNNGGITIDQNNPTQNANTDIWFWPNTEEYHTKYPNAPDYHFVHDNQIDVVDGKLYFASEGKYRIYLRGRVNCALYYSLDGGETYELGAAVKNGSGANFYLNNPDTYFDVEVEDRTWIYIKEILIETTGGGRSFIGVGMAQWTQPMFSISEKHYTADKTEVESSASEGYQYSETTYNDYRGNAVAVVVSNKDSAEPTYYKIVNGKRVASTQEEVTALTETKLIAPTSASYANAYRRDYEFATGDFESDYFYVRSYNYNFVGQPQDVTEGKTITPIAECNYIPWTEGTHDISHLFDGDLNTIIFFNRNWGVSANKPAILAFDMGEVIEANSMTLYADNVTGGNGIKGFPGKLALQGSLDGTEWFDMGNWSTSAQPEDSYEYVFSNSKTYEFRYFKLTITGTCAAKDSQGHVHSGNNRIALSEMKFTNTLRLTGNGANNLTLDDEMFTFSGSWESKQALSIYGHIYVGSPNSEMSFKFTGTRIGFITPVGVDNDFDVYVDGVKVNSVSVPTPTVNFGITYLSERLASGEHTVRLVCKGKGNVSLDSVVYYNETD